MKKLLALLLVLAMVLSMAACGTTKPDPTDPPKATDPNKTPGQTTPTTEDDKRVDVEELDTSWIVDEDPTAVSGTVNFYIPFKGSQGMDAMIAAFNEIYPNVEIKLNTYSNNSDGNASVNTAILAGEVDVLASFGLANTNKRWEAGLFYDLTDLVEENGIDLVEHWGTDAFQKDGTIYTFPSGGLCYYITVNLDAWEAAGLGELPLDGWTWDEYLAASKAMTEYNEDGSVAVYGGSDYHSVNYFTYAVAQVVGKDHYYNAEGMANFDSDAFLKALQREYDAELVDKIWYPKAIYRGDNIQAQQSFLQDQMCNSEVTCNQIRFMADRANYGTDWKVGFLPYPVEEEGQTNYMSGISPFSHSGLCIDESDEDFDAAWAFLRWYSTYGVAYLVAAGHQPNWKGTSDLDPLVLLFGSEEEAAKYMDVESFRAVVGRVDLPAFVELKLTAYSKISSILNEYVMYALNGQMTPEEALAEAAKLANEEIKNAK